MTSENNKSRKFFFDLNNFDQPFDKKEEEIQDEIIVEPPAPVFTEEDIEAAKAVAHAQGFKEGQTEEKQQREQHIANYLRIIAENFSTLHAAELYRERQYEEESIKLGLEILSIITPSLRDIIGHNDLKVALQEALAKQGHQSEIRIEIHPDSVADIQNTLNTLWPDQDAAPRYKIIPSTNLSGGACQISWKDGGMIRNPEKTANDIKKSLELLLAEKIPAKTDSPLTNSENNAIKEKNE